MFILCWIYLYLHLAAKICEKLKNAEKYQNYKKKKKEMTATSSQQTNVGGKLDTSSEKPYGKNKNSCSNSSDFHYCLSLVLLNYL